MIRRRLLPGDKISYYAPAQNLPNKTDDDRDGLSEDVATPLLKPVAYYDHLDRPVLSSLDRNFRQYETTWKGLRNDQRAALQKAGLVTKHGRIKEPE
jgi:hypothetical protein